MRVAAQLFLPCTSRLALAPASALVRRVTAIWFRCSLPTRFAQIPSRFSHTTLDITSPRLIPWSNKTHNMPHIHGLTDGNHPGSRDAWGNLAQLEKETDPTASPPAAPAAEATPAKILSRVGAMLMRGRSSSASAGREMRRTAHLDGLRGFAALLVYWHHHELWAHNPYTETPVFEYAFGHDGRFHFAGFHGIRLLFAGGHLAVATFFVISGYVLAAKPMSLVHSGDASARLLDNVGSALFRRWLRLFIPVIVTTLAFALVWTATDSWIFGMEHQPTWRAELWRWYAEGKNFTFVFNAGGDPWYRYNPHLWSIPVEFKGSIVVYTTLLALSRCTRNARLLCQCALIVYFLYIVDGWYAAMFISGMLQCDLDLLAVRGELPEFLVYLEPFKRFVAYHVLAIAVYLGGVPSRDHDMDSLRRSWGWYYLSFLKPQAVFDYKWFYLFIAANMLVAAVPRIPTTKQFFELRFCQYLGRISFGLYLCHGPILWLFGDRVYTAVGWHNDEQRKNLAGWVDRFPLPRTGPLGLEIGFLLPHVIMLPMTLWLAEATTRFVDEPSVRFAQWLYGATLPSRPVKPILP